MNIMTSFMERIYIVLSGCKMVSWDNYYYLRWQAVRSWLRLERDKQRRQGDINNFIFCQQTTGCWVSSDGQETKHPFCLSRILEMGWRSVGSHIDWWLSRGVFEHAMGCWDGDQQGTMRGTLVIRNVPQSSVWLSHQQQTILTIMTLSDN